MPKDESKNSLIEEPWVWGLLPHDPDDLRKAIELLLELERDYSEIVDIVEIRIWIAMSYFNLAEAKLSLKYFELARKDVLCASDERKRYLDILFIDHQLAAIYLHLGEGDKAKRRCAEGQEYFYLYKDAEGTAGRTTFCFLHGMVLNELGEHEAAISAFKTGIKVASELEDKSIALYWTSNFHHYTGIVYANGLLQPKKALKSLLKVKFEHLKDVQRPNAIASLIYRYYDLDKEREIVHTYETYSEELEKLPKKDVLHHTVGVAYFQTDHLKESRRFLELSDKEDPTDQFVIDGNKRFLEAIDEEEKG